MSLPDRMQAAFYSEFGNARDVLQLAEIPAPRPAAGEVLVEVKASGLNPHDTKKRSGWLGVPLPRERTIPHSDGAGKIVACGENVDASRLGERVFVHAAGTARPGEGTAAGYVAVPAECAVLLPDGIEYVEGACLGVPAITAYYATLADGPITGQTVLVQGGAGAVGSFAIELARWNGAAVIATVSSADKAELARSAGADHLIDYRREDVASRVLELTGGRGVDRIVEVDLGDNMDVDAECLARNGVVASYSSTRNRTPIFPYYKFALRGARFHLVQVGTAPAIVLEQACRTISALLARGLLRPRIAGRFPLAEIAAAHELLESGEALGNIVLELAAADG